MKNLWSEFKAFAFKGNMIELAVAVVIGAAFSTVINSLVGDVIMPMVGYVVNTATTVAEKTKDAATSAVGMPAAKPATTEQTPAAGATPASPAAPAGAPATASGQAAPVKIDLHLGPVNVGAFIGALLNFLLVAAAVFLVIVKLLGSVMKKVSKAPAASAPTTKECQFCLSLIPIKAIKCPHCTADLPAILGAA